MNEQFTMYRLAYHLVKHDRFDVLHINENEEEIWLERLQNKTSHVIRLLNQRFDWKNHLKKDIAIVFQKTKAMKRLLKGKHIQVHNVYISSHAPVDDWETLKKPLKLNEKNPIRMQVYYLDKEEKEEELNRLTNDISGKSMDTPDDIPEIEKQQKISHFKHELADTLYRKQKKVKSVFSHGRPFFTYLLLAVNILVFLVLEIYGDSTSTETLITFGAKFNPAIMDGEWWRIASSMFLHIGVLHLLMNMIALYYLGPTVERLYGSWRFSLIYFLAGIGGGLASFAMSENVSAGASGALFGLFGALLYFGLMYKDIFFQTMGKGILVLIAVNIVFGMSVPQVDNSAHIGGLITGFLASAIVSLPRKQKLIGQLAALVGYAIIAVSLILFGMQQNVASYHLVKIHELLNEGNYTKVVEHAEKGLENPGDLKPQLLFQRSYAYIQLGNSDLAIKDLEKIVNLTDSMPEAYYNLAMLYYNEGLQKKAEEAVKKAYQLKPNDDGFIQLYRQIIGHDPK